MAGQAQKKRPNDSRLQRPSKKQKRQREYHSDSESEAADEFDAVDVLDSDDDDIHNVQVDEGTDGDDDSDSSGSSARGRRTLKSASTMNKRPSGGKSLSKRSGRGDRGNDDDDDDFEDEDEDEDEDGDEDDDEDGEGDSNEEQDGAGSGSGNRKSRSKRNDPSAFATSISKILSTKLSSSKRSDPVLARSAAAHEASKAAIDSALESKARRQLKEQKRRALEKGRVKDVLMAPNDETAGESEVTAAEIMENEKRLRKTAHRGVVKMFNAVRAAQVKAFEAERLARKEGVIGIGQRELKAKELSKKGFLELMASGGGSLKKDGLEEA